jgi:hypothetical protein
MNRITRARAWAVFTGAWVGAIWMTPMGSASAGTFQCDNDRAASQYPNCSTPAAPGWVHRSGQHGDWNGDDRLGTDNDAFYQWFFTNLGAGRSFTLRAWLANAAFTETEAAYGVPGDPIVERFDQNSAPGGWSTIGRHGFSAGRVTIQLGSFQSNARQRIGADLIEIITSNTALLGVEADAGDAVNDPALCGARAIDPAIAAIQQRMLNAIDQFRDARGSFDIMFSNNGQDEHVEFALSEESPGSYVRIADRAGQVRERAFDGRHLVQLDHARRTSRSDEVAPAIRPSGPRQFFNAACEPVFVRRQDPAAAHAAHAVVLPQNYAFWLSDADAKILGSASLLGRDATLIEGTPDAYLADKLGATTFRMWVDDATGALLRLVGTDALGNVAYSIEVRNIEFDRGVDTRLFSSPAPIDGKQLR